MFTSKYLGESLAALASHEVRQATSRLLDDIARDAQLTLYDAAREATPSRSGRTRDSWLPRRLRHEDGRIEAAVSNDSQTAVYLNYGTEAHDVKADHGKALSTPAGPRASVDVAGVAPHHMLEKATEAVARTIQETTLPARERWRSEVEESISLNKRRP